MNKEVLHNFSFEFIDLKGSSDSISRDEEEKKKKKKKKTLSEKIFEQASELSVPEDDTKTVLTEWHRKRECVYGFTGIDQDHSCNELCIDAGYIDIINHTLSLYGCLFGGVHHVCNPAAKSCKNSLINSDSEYICVYSKISTGVVIDSRGFYNAPDKNRMDNDGENDAIVDDVQVVKGSEDEPIDWEMTPVEVEDDDESAPSKDEEFAEKPPEEEEGAEEDSNVDESSMMDCDFDGGSPQSTDRRSKKRTCFQKGNPSVFEEAEHIIKDLIYNTRDRSSINEKREDELKKLAAISVKKYYKECRGAGFRPSISAADEKYASVINRKPLLSILNFDRRRSTYYAHVCTKIWSCIIQSPYWKKNSSIFHFRHHVLGTLYVMKSGDLINSIEGSRVVLARDEYLVKNLPDQNDLCNIIPSKGSSRSYSKSDITKGRNNIKQSLNSMSPEEKDILIDDLAHLACQLSV